MFAKFKFGWRYERHISARLSTLKMMLGYQCPQMLQDSLGGFSGGTTPESIPNSEVKSSSAEDTTNGGKVGRCQGFSFFTNVKKESYVALCEVGCSLTSYWFNP